MFRLGGLSAWELTKRVVTDSRNDDVLGTSAQLSFYLLLAFFPMMIFACSAAASTLTNQDEFSHWLLQYVQPMLPETAFQLVRATLDQVLKTSHVRIGSLLFALWSASYGIEAVIDGLNVAFDVREYRRWWKRRFLAILMTVVLTAALMLAFVLVVWGGTLGKWMADRTDSGTLVAAMWPLIRWMSLVVFLSTGITLIYRFGPNLKRETVVGVLPGAAVAILLWIGACFSFRLYVGEFYASYENVYGSLGAVVAVMLWLYLSSAALLVGAEVNSEIRWAASDAGEPSAREALEENRKR